ncbi:MAG: hypothetical protein EHM64_16670, partial [Ignavibacteriae bacterium]
MDTEKREPETENQATIPVAEPQFKSGFKAWIRTVAFLVVAVFLPEQVAQAAQYDWRVIWNRPTSVALAPSYVKDVTNIQVPLAIKNILKDIANKPVTSIKLSPTLSVELDKPLKISNRRIDEIFNWLKGRTCGSKALSDFLNYQGIAAAEQDAAVFALTVDILNDVVKPVGNPEVIKNSLYALAKTSEFYGFKLNPVKIDPELINGKDVATIVPFIAHFKGDHYVLVSNITVDKVYYIDEHKEEFLPKEKFLQRFSGNALIGVDAGVARQLTDKEAKKVLGAGYDDNYYSSNTQTYIPPVTTSTNTNYYSQTSSSTNYSLGGTYFQSRDNWYSDGTGTGIYGVKMPWLQTPGWKEIALNLAVMG